MSAYDGTGRYLGNGKTFIEAGTFRLWFEGQSDELKIEYSIRAR